MKRRPHGFAERLRMNEEVRRDLPCFEDEASQTAYFQTIREILIGSWHTNLCGQYLDHLDASSESRAHLNLPWSANSDVLPSDDTTLSFRWASSRPVLIDPQVEEDDIHMICKSRRWRFSKAAHRAWPPTTS